MSTGGSGGGFSNKIGEAWVELLLKDQKYYQGLGRAESGIKQWSARVSRMRLADPFSKSVTSAGSLAGRVGSLNRELRLSVGHARQLASILGRMPGGGAFGGRSSPASLLRAQGVSNAAFVRSLGQAASTFSSGLGRGLGAAAKGFGSGLERSLRGSAPAIRSLGSSLSTVARGFGSALSSSLRGAGSMLGGAGRLASGGGSLLGGVGRVAGIGGLLGGAGVGLYGVREAMRQESAAARLTRLSGLRGGKLDSLMGGLKGQTGESTVGNVGDVTDAAAMGARMGVAGPQLRLFTADLMQMKAAVEDIPLDELSERLGRLMGLFRMGAPFARNYASVLVSLDNASTASARDILDVATRSAGGASVMGLKPTQLMALAAASRECGMNPEAAGGALSQLFSNMIDPKRRGAFGRMAGTNAKGFGAMMGRDPFAAVQAVASGVGRMEPDKAVAELEAMGMQGIRTRQLMLGLAASQEKLAKFSKLAADEFRSLNAVTEAAALQSATTEGQLQKLQNRFSLLMGELGRGALSVLKGLADGFGDLGDDVRMMLEGNRGGVDATEHTRNAVSTIGVAFLELPTFAELARVKLAEKYDQIVEVGKRFGSALWSNIKVAFSNGISFLENAFSKIGGFLGNLFSQVGANLGATIRNSIQGALRGIPGLGRAVGANVPVPAINPNLGMLKGLGAGMQPMPGFNAGAIFGGLPNRNAQAAPLKDRLAQARERAAADRRDFRGRQRVGDWISRAIGNLLGGPMPPGVGGAEDEMVIPGPVGAVGGLGGGGGAFGGGGGVGRAMTEARRRELARRAAILSPPMRRAGSPAAGLLGGMGAALGGAFGPIGMLGGLGFGGALSPSVAPGEMVPVPLTRGHALMRSNRNRRLQFNWNVRDQRAQFNERFRSSRDAFNSNVRNAGIDPALANNLIPERARDQQGERGKGPNKGVEDKLAEGNALQAQVVKLLQQIVAKGAGGAAWQ